MACRRSYISANEFDSEAARAKTYVEKRLKTFYANMSVARLEEWCVQAQTAEEAHASPSAGEPCRIGDCACPEIDDSTE